MANYDVSIKLAVAGAKELDRVNKRTELLKKNIDFINNKAQKGTAGMPVVKNFKNLSQAVTDANDALNKAAVGTKEFNQAVKNVVQVEAKFERQQKQKERRFQIERLAQKESISFSKAKILLAKQEAEAEAKLAAQKQKTARAEKNKRRNRIVSSAAIGGGFPLLFGGGIGPAIFGAAGGAIGESITKGGGFAGSIAATALVTELTKIGQASIETAGKLSTLNGKLELARERSLFTSNETEELARQLERQGKAQELNNLLNQEYQKIIGAEGVAKLNKLNEVSTEFNRLMGILKTNFDAFIAGPLTRLLKFLNNILGQQANRGQFDRLRSSLEGQEKENFEARLKELQGTRRGKGTVRGPITDAIRKTMMTEFGSQPLSVPKGKSLTPQAQLGIDRMADLDEEIEKATLKNTLSEKDFEIKMRIQEIQKGTLDLEDVEIRKKLEKLYKLDEEQEKLKKIDNLYKGIGNSIETGIVNAIDGAITGTMKLGEIATSVFGSIRRQLITFGVNTILGGIPGLDKIFGKAKGGPVKGGQSYIVGEKGPELFTPGSSGNITPNHALGGSTNIVVNVDASGSSVESNPESARKFGEGQVFKEEEIILNRSII